MSSFAFHHQQNICDCKIFHWGSSIFHPRRCLTSVVVEWNVIDSASSLHLTPNLSEIVKKSKYTLRYALLFNELRTGITRNGNMSVLGWLVHQWGEVTMVVIKRVQGVNGIRDSAHLWSRMLWHWWGTSALIDGLSLSLCHTFRDWLFVWSSEMKH